MSSILSPENIRLALLILAIIGAALIIVKPLQRTAKAREDLVDLVHDKLAEQGGYIAALHTRVNTLEGHMGGFLRRFGPDQRSPQALPAPRVSWEDGSGTDGSGRRRATSGGGNYGNGHELTGEVVDRRVTAAPFNVDDPQAIARHMHELLPTDAQGAPTVWFDERHPDEENFGGATWFDYIRQLLVTRHRFIMNQAMADRVKAIIETWKR